MCPESKHKQTKPPSTTYTPPHIIYFYIFHIFFTPANSIARGNTMGAASASAPRWAVSGQGNWIECRVRKVYRLVAVDTCTTTTTTPCPSNHCCAHESAGGKTFANKTCFSNASVGEPPKKLAHRSTTVHARPISAQSSVWQRDLE